MASEISVASTTDTQEAVNTAAGLAPNAKPEEEVPEQATIEPQPKPEETPKSEAAKAEEHEEAEPEPPKRSKGGFQKRIDTLTRRNYELEELAERLSSRLEVALTRIEGTQPQGAALGGQAAPAAPRLKPQVADFKTYEEYIDAVADWRSEQRIAQYRAEEEQRQLQASQQAEAARTQQVFSSYNQRVAEFRSENEDYDAVVGREDVQIPQAVQLAVVEMDNGPEVAYYLGLHPEICEELLAMTPLQSAIEAGRISDALKAAHEPAGESGGNGAVKRPVSTAPKPIRSVSGSAPSAVPLDQMDYRDYRRIRDQQVRNRYRNG